MADLTPEQWDAWGLDDIIPDDHLNDIEERLDGYYDDIETAVSGVSIHTTFIVSNQHSGDNAILAEQIEDLTRLLEAYDQYNSAVIRLASHEGGECTDTLIKDVFERKTKVEELVDEYYKMYGIVLGIEL